jgi:hypothetical protein
LRQALVALNLFFVALKSAATQFEKKSQFETKNGSLRRKSFAASTTAWVSFICEIQRITDTMWTSNVRSTLLSEEIEDFSLYF